MITRFRVEGKHIRKENLEAQLLQAATKIMQVADTNNNGERDDLSGDWECTDDRIMGKPGAYKGRMVFVFEEAN